MTLDPAALATTIQSMNPVEAASHLSWHTFGPSLLMLIAIPFIVTLVASASTGSLTKKNWPKLIIPLLATQLIILTLILTGILPARLTIQ